MAQRSRLIACELSSCRGRIDLKPSPQSYPQLKFIVRSLNRLLTLRVVLKNTKNYKGLFAAHVVEKRNVGLRIAQFVEQELHAIHNVHWS